MTTSVSVDSAMVELVAEFDRKVEDFLDKKEAGQQEKQLIKERLGQVFRENLRLGLATVFGGKTDEVSPAAAADLPPTEITVDDIMAKEDAILQLASRRKRYPDVASDRLAKTLKKNRATLKQSQVKLPGQQGLGEELTRLVMEPDKETNEALYRVEKDLTICKELVVTTGQKTDRLIDALEVLNSVEEVCLHGSEDQREEQ